MIIKVCGFLFAGLCIMGSTDALGQVRMRQGGWLGRVS